MITAFRMPSRNTAIGLLVPYVSLKSVRGKYRGHGGAAERLGIKRTTVQNKMRRLGITKRG